MIVSDRTDKELLIRYIEGRCSEEETVNIINWMDAEPGNMKEYAALRKLYDMTVWQTPTESWNSSKKKKPVRRIYIEVIKIAAVLIVGILVSGYFIRYDDKGIPVANQTLHVPAGQRAEIVLADGTRVWLNAKTTLTFPTLFRGNKREVILDGEAFFEVKTDKSKPFIVKTSQYDVKVWGTRFNLLAYSFTNIFETSLFEGSVEVLKPKGANGVFIHPNERIYTKNDQLIIGDIVNTNQFLWKEGIISFDNESFSEMVKKLELYFDLKIDVHNENILKYRCTGKFRTNDGVEHILQVLQFSNKFRYAINDKRNTILIE